MVKILKRGQSMWFSKVQPVEKVIIFSLRETAIYVAFLYDSWWEGQTIWSKRAVIYVVY